MPASGVNKRFVIILVATLGAIAATVTLAALYVARKDGERNIRQGDALAAQGDWKGASKAYSRGVNKDQTRVDWMEKWRDALTKVVPENATVFNENYSHLRGVTLKIAQTKRTDAKAYEAFFARLLEEFESFGGGAAAWTAMVTEVERALAGFEIAKVDPSTGWPALRRFRGMALVNHFAVEPTLDPQKIEQAKDDLETSLAILPSDLDSQTSLAQWCVLSAGKAEKAGKADEAKRLMDRANTLIDSIENGHADDPRALARALRFRVGLSNRSVTSGENEGMVIAERQAKLLALKPQLERLVRAVEATPPAELELPKVEPLVALSPVIDPERGTAIADAALARALSGRPTDAHLLMVSARQLVAKRKYEEAIARYQQVADLPNLPVGLDGLRLFMFKNAAVIQQASASLGLVGSEPDPTKRQAAIDRAKAYRQKLANEVISGQSAELLLLDAKLKIAEGDTISGQQLLAEYSRKTGDRGADAVESLMLQGGIALERGEFGRARDAFEKVVEINPAINAARLHLASAHERLGDHAKALKVYLEAEQLAPNDEGIKTKIQILRPLVGGKVDDLNKIEDPIRRLLVEAELLLKGGAGKPGDPASARRLVETNLEKHKYDPRMVGWLLSQLVGPSMNEAISFMERVVAANPDNADFRTTLSQLKTSQDPNKMVEAIKAAKKAPADEAVEIYQVLKRVARGKEAIPYLKQAYDAGTVDHALFDAYFVASYEADDLATAEAVVERAAKEDVDKVSGRTFRARLAMMQGKNADAEVILKQLVETGAAPAAVWRLLAAVQQAQRRPQDALASIQQARSIQPNDIELAKFHLRLLDSTGQTSTALTEALKLESLARGDREFTELIVELQTRAGDRAGALERRTRIYLASPGDESNAMALAELFLEDAKVAQAETVLAKLPPTGANSRLAFLRARVLAEQGQMPKAREVMDEHLAAAHKAQGAGVTPYLVYVQFLVNYKQYDDAIAMCDKAASAQDPATRLADHAKADLLIRLARYKEAADVYRAMLATGSTLARPLPARLYLVRTLMAMGETGEAEKELAQAESLGKDLDVQLLKAELMQGRGEVRAARGVLDGAVAAFPGQATVYVRRAALLMNDPMYARDALADLDTAIKLEPKNSIALQARGAARFQSGDIEGGLKDFRAASDADPMHVGLRVALVNELLNRGREAEAAEAANVGINRSSGNIGLAVQLGDTFAARRLWPRAQAIYRDLWERTKAPAAAERYVSSLLRSSQPSLAEAERVLGAPEAKTGEYWGLLILRAELRSKEGNERAVQGDLLTALSLAGRDPRMVNAFYDAVKAAFAGPGQARRQFEAITRTPQGTEQWIPLYLARLRFEELTLAGGALDTTAAGSLLEAVERVRTGAEAQTPQQPALLFMTNKLASDVAMAIGRFEDAVQSGKRALAIADDPMLNNNVAYLLADQLNRAEEAVPLAEKAAQALPARGDVLDTLGTVYQKLGQHAKAVAPLAKAVASSRSPGEKAFSGAKLVRAQIATGRKEAARETLAQIRTWRASDATAAKRVSDSELEELARLTER